jgi:glycosyltransferase involved in cell wall biosynthesis
MLQATLSSSSRVHFLGWVDPEMLPALYKRADCFVFASAEETFGIPAIEAMASRVPVAVPSLRKATEELFIPFDEICGDAVAYFDPFDPVDIAKQVHHVLSDEEFRLELIRRGSLQAKLYTWDATARGLREVFHASR